MVIRHPSTGSLCLASDDPCEGSRQPSRASLQSAFESEDLLFLGIVPLEYDADFARFQTWLSENRHGDLKYLENHSEIRERPEQLLPGARRAVLFALPYFLKDTTPAPRVALYARHRDYHRELKERAERVGVQFFAEGDYRVVVDSAPILERALAASTAQGFIGKNTLYIHPQKGSFLLLGELLTRSEMEIDSPSEIALDRKTTQGGCGPCRQCQVECPTGALDKDYSMDARRCLSYWTIEQRGPIPQEYWPHLAKYYFGCDLCQLACPYNKHATEAPGSWPVRSLPSVEQVAVMSQTEYESWFGGTAMTRAKRNGLRRNALIALAVTGHPGLVEALDHVSRDADSVLEQTRDEIRSSQWFKPAPLSQYIPARP